MTKRTHYFIHHFTDNNGSDTDFIGGIKNKSTAINKARGLKTRGLNPSLHKVVTDTKKRCLDYYFVDIDTGTLEFDETKHLEEWE